MRCGWGTPHGKAQGDHKDTVKQLYCQSQMKGSCLGELVQITTVECGRNFWKGFFVEVNFEAGIGERRKAAY